MIERVAQQLFVEGVVTVGGCTLRRDVEVGLIWLTDAYGVDCIGASGTSEDDCKKAVRNAVARDAAPHPAEMSW